MIWLSARQIRMLFLNSGYQLYEMCPLVEAETEAAACRAYMFARQTVRNLVVPQVHEAPAVFHGHIVSVITHVRSKSHRSRHAVELFRLDVDLLVDGNDMCPSTGRRCDVLGRCNRRGYAHLTRLDNEHANFQLTESERRTVLQWHYIFTNSGK